MVELETKEQENSSHLKRLVHLVYPNLKFNFNHVRYSTFK